MNPTHRHRHAADAALQTHYVGSTMEVIDLRIGKVRWAGVFVAVLCVLSLTFALGLGQGLPDWIEGRFWTLS